MLSRRECSEAQVRTSLARREHAPDDIDAAITRLKDERALDDVRTAGAIARTSAAVKRLGPRGARRAIEAAGISGDTADAAVAAAFESVDARALIESVVDRRLAFHDGPIDDRVSSRLYRYLVSRGHDADLIGRVLRERRQGRRST
jgi:SOS response regulatory protein OraA/RecX